MTGTDKTGDQLVASIRKTKSAASTAKKAPARRKPAQSAAKKQSTLAPKQPAGDSYRSGRRIWPD
jgi:hypothetical protein